MQILFRMQQVAFVARVTGQQGKVGKNAAVAEYDALVHIADVLYPPEIRFDAGQAFHGQRVAQDLMCERSEQLAAPVQNQRHHLAVNVFGEAAVMPGGAGQDSHRGLTPVFAMRHRQRVASGHAHHVEIVLHNAHKR